MSNCYIVMIPDYEWQEIVAAFKTKRMVIKWAIKHRPKNELKRLCFYRTRGELVVDISEDIKILIQQAWRSELRNERLAE